MENAVPVPLGLCMVNWARSGRINPVHWPSETNHPNVVHSYPGGAVGSSPSNWLGPDAFFLSGALSVSASICHILRHKHTHTHSRARVLAPSLSLSLSLSFSRLSSIQEDRRGCCPGDSSIFLKLRFISLFSPWLFRPPREGGCSFPVGQVPSSWKANARGLRWPHQPNQLLLILIDDK